MFFQVRQCGEGWTGPWKDSTAAGLQQARTWFIPPYLPLFLSLSPLSVFFEDKVLGTSEASDLLFSQSSAPVSLACPSLHRELLSHLCSHQELGVTPTPYSSASGHESTLVTDSPTLTPAFPSPCLTRMRQRGMLFCNFGTPTPTLGWFMFS